MAAPEDRMRRLFERLRAAGFTRPFVKRYAVPGWWTDELAAEPAAWSTLLLTVSRCLGVDIDSLLEEGAAIRLKDFGPCKYKKMAGTSEDDLAHVRALASRVAQIAASATQSQPPANLPSAKDLRDHILNAAPWVSLEALLDACWELGVSVVPVSLVPPAPTAWSGRRRKMDGFAAHFAGRPAIVVASGRKQPAWLLFIIAHELGHLTLGHVPKDGALIDNDWGDASEDEEEREADRFAVELLAGDPDFIAGEPMGSPTVPSLVSTARAQSDRCAIDPGHYILNYAFSRSREGTPAWPIAAQALKRLSPVADAPSIVRERMVDNLNWAELPTDVAEFLVRATASEPEAEAAEVLSAEVLKK